LKRWFLECGFDEEGREGWRLFVISFVCELSIGNIDKRRKYGREIIEIK
jgi:hypothetical protein